MPLTAAHPEAGLLDATVADLGTTALTWAGIHRVRPLPPLTCRGCGGPVTAKVSVRGLRFFAHRVATPDCPSAGETIAHRMLKLELATAARAAGWHAELEFAEDSWRADVLTTSPDGSRRVAWEAQLAAVTVDEIAARTACYAEAGVEVCWVTDRDPPWLQRVPSARVEHLPDDTGLHVVAGHARFKPEWCSNRTRCEVEGGWGRLVPPCPGHGGWSTPGPLPLREFVAHVCRNVLRSHTATAFVSTPHARHGGGPVVWTAHVHWLAERKQAQALERFDQWMRAQSAAADTRTERDRQHDAAVAALLARQNALLRPTVELCYHEAGVYPHVRDGTRDAAWAMGVPVFARGRLFALICPVASRITPTLALRFGGALIVVASDAEQARLARVTRTGQRFAVFEPGHGDR